ncbi:histidine kinase [Micromonospora sp. WMMD1128]|uniref:sensor histidine kinase n=1 Tax=Micromonospora sp. WMMD1128 TaxID=3015150 RepID=UPI00248C3D48|nr:histidine kinase [Micromonospora sp. WMMD1128]WBB76406.1 histidine kinase [Micromonospora sp. WMMD1128]
MTQPSHLAGALRHRRYPLTAWPWRALAYAASTLPVVGVLAVAWSVVAAPLLLVASALRRGRPVDVPVLAALAVLALAALAVAPLASAPVAALERWRLRLVDDRPLAGPLRRGPAARWASAAAWREVAYAAWLATAVPLAYGTFGLLVLLDVTLVAGPWLTGDGERIVLIWATVDSPAGAVPYAVAGVLAAPALVYLAGLLVVGQATVARWLLDGAPDAVALREVTRSRARLMGAYEAERRRIERDVHDGAQPRLTSLSLQLGLARLDVPDGSPAAGPLDAAHEQAKELMVTLRGIVQGIRPRQLTELGLAGAVGDLAGRSVVPVTVHADLPRPVPELVETTAWYVVSEALGNVARHAHARHAVVRLTRTDRRLVVEVEDDGRGGADPARGTGLTGLADRVGAVDGRLLLASPPGGPTLVRVELPCRP